MGVKSFVLFQFSTPLVPTSITIDPYGVFDRDVSYWTGTTASPLNLTGSGLASLGGLGFGSRQDVDNSASDLPLTISLVSGPVTSLLFAPRVGTTDNDDYFKIRDLTASSFVPPTSVAEPGTLLFLGLGLAGLGYMARRRFGGRRG